MQNKGGIILNLNLSENHEEPQKTEDALQNAQELLTKMQNALQGIKSAKTNQDNLQVEIKQLVEQLAEKQAEEERIAEKVLNLEIAWQELTQEFVKIGDLSASSDQSRK